MNTPSFSPILTFLLHHIVQLPPNKQGLKWPHKHCRNFTHNGSECVHVCACTGVCVQQCLAAADESTATEVINGGLNCAAQTDAGWKESVWKLGICALQSHQHGADGAAGLRFLEDKASRRSRSASMQDASPTLTSTAHSPRWPCRAETSG